MPFSHPSLFKAERKSQMVGIGPCCETCWWPHTDAPTVAGKNMTTRFVAWCTHLIDEAIAVEMLEGWSER